MLRAARSKIFQHTSYLPSTEPLFLQFLYPVSPLNAPRARFSSSSFVAKNTQSTQSTPSPQSRSHSTATIASIPIPDGIPTFQGDMHHFTRDNSCAGYIEALKSKPGPIETPSLVIVDTPRLADQRAKRPRVVGGISEDKHEVLATFEACITVGRIARAQLMLKVITSLLDRTSPLLIGAHNTFLKALLSRAQAEISPDSLRIFFGWYEDTMMREICMFGNATTFALLLKGSCAINETESKEQYIIKYINSWKGSGNDVKDIFALPILSENEIVEACRIYRIDVKELCEEHRELYLKEEPIGEPQITKVPEVVSSSVKGASLASIRQSLLTLTDPDAMPSRHGFGQDDLAFQIERQKLLEYDAIQSAQDRWKKDFEDLAAKGVAPVGSNINTLLWSWHQSMVPLIKQELKRVAEAEKNPDRQNAADRCLYGPFLRLMTPEKVAAIVVLEMIKQQNTQLNGEGTKSSFAVMNVGKILEQEYYAQELSKRKNQGLFGTVGDLNELFADRVAFQARVSKARKSQLERPEESADLMLEWPPTIRAKLGAVLISMLLHCAKTPVTKQVPVNGKVTQYIAAMNHAYEYIKGRRLGVIRLHPEVVKLLGQEPRHGSTLGRNLPMLVPPRPWIAWNEGGYYYTQSRVVRTKSSKEQNIYVEAASKKGDLEGMFRGLDVLGQTAWKVNKKVFDVVLKVWNDGEPLADIPPRKLELEIPPEPAPSSDPKIRHEWIRHVRELKHRVQNNHSRRCDINLKLEIARAFLFETFYFPHNVDFRGRAYPIPPNLNHIGNDLSRGLLMFAEAKRLGSQGLYWLKVHCANLYGYDKASFTDRVRFVDEHLEQVFDSADNPLDGKRWWLKAEDPWQCLATCMSIKEAIDFGDHTEYMCNTVVAQDGTCNGLQHYAALGGDLEGARQVNLEPSDKPQDIYTGVAELVKMQVEKDAAAGDEIALLLQGKVTRKVVKQSVMTNVYGVTFIGARQQIQNQLEDIPEIPREQLSKCASYLAKAVFSSIKTVFTGATKIQRWLAMSARMISRSVSPAQFGLLKDHSNGKLQDTNFPHVRRKGKVEFMTSVVWTNPLGMAIVQPYRQENTVVVQTNLQKIYISDPSAIDQVNSRKQMTAYPPNFIHSLDATHMLLSAVKCAEHNLTFAAVHDSFWTHPGDVETLNRILRDAFVSLHSEEVMQNLKQEFETRYNGHKYLVSIPATSEAAKLIKIARREYATGVLGKVVPTVVEDLEWELQRDRLLASDNSEDRNKGEAMITPSVILNKYGGAVATEVNESLGAALGDVEAKVGVVPDAESAQLIGSDTTFNDSPLNGNAGAGVASVSIDERLDEDGETALVDESPDAAAEEEPEEDVKAKPKKPVAVAVVWMPLEFMPLPPKGGFDVERLKGSQYFFS